MGLNDIKRKLAKEEASKLSMQIAEEQKKQMMLQSNIDEMRVSTANDLPKLQLLEDKFWDFIAQFSEIVKLEVQDYSKRKTFFRVIKLSSIKTWDDILKGEHYPLLSVNFKCDRYNWKYNHISLEAKEGILYFRAKDGFSKSNGPALPHHSEVYASHASQYDLSSFDRDKAVKWLEEQFVIYWNQLQKGKAAN